MAELVIARIEMLLPEKGGRKQLALSGWRPCFRYDGKNWSASVNSISGNQESYYPGQSYEVELRFIFDEPAEPRPEMIPGLRFELTEGNRVSAVGEVIRTKEG